MDKKLVAQELVLIAKELVALSPEEMQKKVKEATSDNAKKILETAKEATRDLQKVRALFDKMDGNTPLLPKNFKSTGKTISSLPDLISTAMNELHSIEHDMQLIIEKNK